MIAALIAAVAMLYVPQQEAPSATALIFEFPDGARGGHGKIQGTGTWTGGRWDDLTLAAMRGCGAANVRKPDLRVTHRAVIFSDSTSRDRDVVACVQRSVPLDFTVYLGSPSNDFSSRAQWDDTPFREFWTPLKQTNKVN